MLLSERKRLDKALKNRGFGGMDDPELVRQLAFVVRDHEHFRQVLTGVEPDKRTIAYEAMRPYLRFEAKPLDVYLAEAADLAARREKEQTPLEIAAEAAIRRNIADENAKGALTLKCHLCTREMAYPGKNREDAAANARIDGWRVSQYQDGPSSGQLVAHCPACAKVRAEFQRA